MAEDKKSFVLYTDMISVIEQLPLEVAGKLFRLILDYVNDKNPSTEDLLLNIAFTPIKNQLKRDLKEWEEKKDKYSKSGREGGLKSAEKRKSKQNEAISSDASNFQATSSDFKQKQPVNVNVNDNVTVNDNINSDSVESAESEELSKPLNPEKGKEKSSAKKEKSFHEQYMDAYTEFYEKEFEVKPQINGADGKALKGFIPHMKRISKGKTDEDGLMNFKLLLSHWQSLDAFTKKQTDLCKIIANINSIIAQLKSHVTKPASVSTYEQASATINEVLSDPNFKGSFGR